MNFTKTIINAIKSWVNSKLNESKADWSQTDTSQLNYIKNKPEIATDEDVIDLMLDMDLMPVVQDVDGTILIDSDNAIILS